MSAKKNEDKSLKQSPMPPIPFAEKDLKPKDKSSNEMTVSDAEAKIKEMQKTYDALIGKLEEAMKLTGWDLKDMEGYFSNPSNFSKEEWEQLSQDRKSMLSKLMNPADFAKLQQREKSGRTSGMAGRKKETKRKKLPGMRKNWLRMD